MIEKSWQTPGTLPPASGSPELGAGPSHVACLLGQGAVHWQCEPDGTILLPAPPDLGESAADARQEKQAFGQDDNAGHQQGEGEGRRQEELVAALLEGTRPAVGERVQRAEDQSHEAQGGLRGKRRLQQGGAWTQPSRQ